MPHEINYQNNPLHGLGLKDMLEQLVEHYGFAILYAYLNINCFKSNPSIESSVKFLKKTDWAREKVEGFYLYQFKSLPRASAEQFELPPRDRVIPDGQVPSEPAELSLEDAERLREKRAKKAADWNKGGKARSDSARSGARKQGDKYSSRHQDKGAGTGSTSQPHSSADPWANWKRNNE